MTQNDEWPRRNLGTAEHWGRVVEQRTNLLRQKQKQLAEGGGGLNRYSAAASEDLARAARQTRQLADDVEALLASMPQYFTSSTAATGFGASADWTTISTLTLPRPEGKTVCTLNVNAVSASYRPVEAPGPPFEWPFPLEYVTSEFGPRDPLPYHRGIDFAGGPAVLGAPIKAAADGVIIRNDYTADDWGWYVRIGHDALTGIPNNWTGYAHLNVQSTLPVGTPVTQGQVIGYLGNSGFSTGAHLHYETAVDNQRINPRDFMASFSGGGGGVTPNTAARVVINGVPGVEFYPHATRGYVGFIRQIHYLVSGGSVASNTVTVELQLSGISGDIPADPRSISSLTAFGNWT